MLALALLFGLEGKRQIRVGSVSVSRNNLNAAAFLDVVCRFYRGDASGDFPGRNALPVGMFADGPANAASRSHASRARWEAGLSARHRKAE